MPVQERKALIKKIEEKRSSRLICCVTSDRNNAQGLIAKDFLYRFFEHLRKMPKLEKLDILLFTLGGDTLAAYALGRFIRQFAKKIGVLVPHTCHSGGTMLALSADDIAMTRVATLSSIDPSIVGLLNPVVEGAPGGQRIPIPVGVESIAGFKNAVREDWRLDEEGTATAFRLLTDKVNPLLLGDLYRAREQIIRLATNLMKLHMSDEDKIRSLVNTLATGLGSHDYLIGPTEARELNLPLAPADADLEDLMWQLYEDFATEMELGVPFDPNIEMQIAAQQARPGPAGQPAAIKKMLKIVVIESTERADVWEREMNLIVPIGQLQVLWNYWRPQ